MMEGEVSHRLNEEDRDSERFVGVCGEVERKDDTSTSLSNLKDF